MHSGGIPENKEVPRGTQVMTWVPHVFLPVPTWHASPGPLADKGQLPCHDVDDSQLLIPGCKEPPVLGNDNGF